MSTVQVTPASNIQSLFDTYPTGTIFQFADGTYHGPYLPKSGHKLRGGPNAIWDGQGSIATPFTPMSIWVKGMTFRNYTEAGVKVLGGKIDGIISHDNGYSGIKFDGSTGVAIIGACELFANGHYGYSGPDSVDATIVDAVVYGNNTSHDPDGGGTKMVRTAGLQIIGGHYHDNLGAGVWLDIDNTDFLVSGVESVDNDLWGIQAEISYDGAILGNTVERNGARGIYVSSSGGTGLTVAFNTVKDNAESQITLGQEPRGSGSQGAYVTQNVNVHDNVVTGCGLVVEEFQYPNAPMGANNIFDNNEYHYKSGVSAWRSLVGDKSFAGWQGLGNDALGVATADAVC